jgi:drug/metabolite transporter (DMT)-like permease
MAGASSQVALWLTLLLLSSMGEAYFPDIMNINGLQAKANWLFLADALGNVCGALVPTKEAWREVPARRAFVPALCDAVSKIFILGGLALSSAQIKSILYNSCIVFSALLSRLVLGRILTRPQWGGIIVLVIGLVIKLDFSKKLVDEGDSAALVPVGMVMILIGCALHSLTNVVNEYYIRTYSFPPPKLCCLIGCFNIVLWTLVFASGFIICEKDGMNPCGHYTRDYIDVGAMGRSNYPLSPMTNGAAWVGFVASSAVHAVSYFFLLGSIGVVSVGVMKGLTTAGYVTLSAIVLCDSAEPTLRGFCPDRRTIVAVCVCVTGVLLYSIASKHAKQAEQNEERHSQNDSADTTTKSERSSQSSEMEMGVPFTTR